MNVLKAWQYVLASSNDGLPGGADLRLAAYIAAMDQFDLTYNCVLLNNWWSSRCQIGLLVGKECSAVGFDATIPCGRQQVHKSADAREFCDLRYRPHPGTVRKAMRRLRILQACDMNSLDELKDRLHEEVIKPLT